MLYMRSDMLFDKYYDWPMEAENASNKIVPINKNIELIRKHGNQVLAFINWLNEKLHLAGDVNVFHKIERLLRYNVPPGLKSFEQIEKWLIENW